MKKFLPSKLLDIDDEEEITNVVVRKTRKSKKEIVPEPTKKRNLSPESREKYSQHGKNNAVLAKIRKEFLESAKFLGEW